MNFLIRTNNCGSGERFYCDRDFSICKQPSLCGLIAIGCNLKVLSKALNVTACRRKHRGKDAHGKCGVNVSLKKKNGVNNLSVNWPVATVTPLKEATNCFH